MSYTTQNGRLGNQIIINLAISLIAEKFDLFVDYYYHEKIKPLGDILFVGKNKYLETVPLTVQNYFSVLNANNFQNNVYSPGWFFQTKEISNSIQNYLHRKDIKDNIIEKNPFKDRYNANNDLFIHIRLRDATKYNPGVNYYLDTIEKIKYDKIFIATDEKTHLIIKEISDKHPNITILEYDEIKTMQFASTCKNIILSNGSFSAIIGYLAFFSTIYYPKYKIMWHGDIFTDKGWTEVEF